MIKLSIIIPIYNAEAYVINLAKSLINQLNPMCEVIFIDDGSTDKSYEILSQFIKLRKGIILIHQENCGASSARNTGLKYAKGQYIAFVDSDDQITDDYIDKLIILTKKNCDIIQFEWMSGSLDNGYRKESVGLSYGECDIGTFAKCVLLQKSNPPWNKLYRREIIQDHNLAFNTKMIVGEDVVFTSNFLMYAKTVFVSNFNIYKYFNNPIGLCSKVNPKYFYDNAIVYNEFTKLVQIFSERNEFVNCINISMLQSVFRTIGFCKRKGYSNGKIEKDFAQSGLESLILNGSYSYLKDKFRRFLIKKKMYYMIYLLTKW